MGLTFGQSLLPAEEFCTGRGKRSDHPRFSKLKHLSALSSPAFCLEHRGGLQRIKDEQNLPRFETPYPKEGVPPSMGMYMYMYMCTHSTATQWLANHKREGVVQTWFRLVFSPKCH